MVLVDKKILVGGIVLLAIGILISINVNSSIPVGQAGMSEEETIDLMIAQQENQDYNTLSGILMGLGFLLILISFGARRKKNTTKRQEKKPVE
jgi:hypothetical protein